MEMAVQMRTALCFAISEMALNGGSWLFWLRMLFSFINVCILCIHIFEKIIGRNIQAIS